MKTFKYLQALLNIFGITSIPDLLWQGKLLVFTYHAKEELEALNKYEEYVLSVLERGTHYLVAKKQHKYNCFAPYQEKYVCVSYVIHESSVIVIHIKPTNKKQP